jgi:hypothetical protein
MSDDIKDGPQPSTSGASQNLRTRTLNGVTFVRRSNLGPITVHSSGSSEASPLPDSRNSPEVEQEIVKKYLESLKAGAERAVLEHTEGKWGLKKKT